MLQLTDAAARDLIKNEACEFTTTLGTLRAELFRSSRKGRWGYHLRYVMWNSGGSGGGEIRTSSDEDLHRQLQQRLARGARQMAH